MAKAKVQKQRKQAKAKQAKSPVRTKNARPKAPPAEASRRRRPIDRVIEEAKEPLSLIETLKEEGMARAGYLLGIAAEVAGSVTKQNFGAQIAELGGVVGMATKADLARLERKIQALSDRLEALETGSSPASQEDDVEDGNEDLGAVKQEPYEEESYRVKSDFTAMRSAEEE